MQAAQDITIGARLNKTQFQYTMNDADPGELQPMGELVPRQVPAPSPESSMSPPTSSLMPGQCSTSRSSATKSPPVTASCPTPSTTRSMTPSGSASSRPCTPPCSNTACHSGGQSQDFSTGPEALNGIYVKSSSGQQVPISTLVDSVVKVAPLVINHQGQFPSVTISFNLAPGTAIGQAGRCHRESCCKGVGPATLPADELSGQRSSAFGASLSSTPILIGASLSRHLSHPRYSVREPDPPNHHYLDPAVGRPRGAAVADGGSLRSERDCDRRHHPADRHRQEERHHAGGFPPSIVERRQRGLTTPSSKQSTKPA